VREQTVAIGDLPLDRGGVLPAVDQRVAIYGEPGRDGRKIALVPHALTGSARVADWWGDLLVEGAPLDPREWTVVGINAVGSCYGSTGPTAGAPFPIVTVADIVRAQRRALDALGISKLDLVIGASLGGMQALQWALDAPERVARAVVIGAHDHQTAMGIAFNSVQRDAIALEPRGGLRIARKLAMLTYKSEALFRARHDRKPDRNGRPIYDVEGYLERQADIFEARMDPAAYVALTHAMDSQDVRDHASTDTTPELLFIGITSDWLFHPVDIRAAAERLRARGFNAAYKELHSDHGHDAFLAEPQALAQLLR
jgi:homoserine O-acetyltransferase